MLSFGEKNKKQQALALKFMFNGLFQFNCKPNGPAIGHGPVMQIFIKISKVPLLDLRKLGHK